MKRIWKPTAHLVKPPKLTICLGTKLILQVLKKFDKFSYLPFFERQGYYSFSPRNIRTDLCQLFLDIVQFIQVIIFTIIISDAVTPPESISKDELIRNVTTSVEKKMSERVLEIINHYKQPDPMGLPGAPIPDPMELPDMKQAFSLGTMNFKNQKLYGLKNFRIHHVVADINAMKVECGLNIELLTVKGNYTLSSWFSRSRGPFIVQLKNVKVTAVARLEVERNGQLEAQEIDMDIKFEKIAMNFTGIGTLFQSK